MWVYQETPETAAAKALPEAIMPTAQEEQLKQKNGGILPETAQDERRSIPAAFSERYGNTPERAAARRSKPSRETILLAAAYLLGTFLAGVAAARCVAGDAETLSYYLNCWQSLFSVQDAAGAVRLFRTEFLTVAGALTAVLFLGLSALGPLPIFLFLHIKLQSEQEGMGASEQELKLYPFLYSDTDALHHRLSLAEVVRTPFCPSRHRCPTYTRFLLPLLPVRHRFRQRGTFHIRQRTA